MREPLYDAETLRKVAAHAARLQSEREARPSSYRERKLTAEDMDQIGREVGLDPALMRQALGHVTALEIGKRRAARQARLAIAACCASLTAGLGFAYKVHLDNQMVVTFVAVAPESASRPDSVDQDSDSFMPSPPRRSAAPPWKPRSVTLGTRGEHLGEVAWSSDGRWIVTVAQYGPVRIWDAVRRQQVRVLRPANRPQSVAWSPDSRRLAIGTGSGWIHIYEAIRGLRVGRIRAGGQSITLAWSPNGQQIAEEHDGSIGIWDVASARRLRRLRFRVNKPSVEPGDGCIMASSQAALAWSPDGSRLAYAGLDQNVRVWNAVTGRLVRRLRGEERDTSGLAWSPDGRRLASGSMAGDVRIWNVTAGRTEQHLRQVLGYVVYSVAWSPNEQWLAVAGDNGGNYSFPLRIYAAASGQRILTLHGHTAEVRSLAWSPDGKQLASAGIAEGSSQAFRIWDLSGLNARARGKGSPQRGRKQHAVTR